MAVYQRGENYYIDFWFKGKRIRESIGPSPKTAAKVLYKRKVEIAENKYLDIREEPKAPEPATFHDFCKEYRAWAKTNKKASTMARDLYIMRTLDKEFEGKQIRDITTWLIEKFKTKRAEKCKPATVNREIGLLKHIFSKAAQWEYIKEDPARGVKQLKGMAKRVRYLMPDEINILLSNCDGGLRGLLRPLATVALHTGARKGELQGLKWENVNFDLGIISLLDTKNGERRDIPMNETVLATLKGLVQKGELVFPNSNGVKIDNTQIHLAFHEALKKSKIEDFHFHDLRHTFASNLMMNGAELNDVRELLGHKKMEMTLRYAHLSPRHKTKVINILDRVMSQNPPQGKRVVSLRG